MADKHTTTITYKGKSFTTSMPYVELTDEHAERIRQDFYAKPPVDLLERQLKTIHNGGVRRDKVTRYYFYRVIHDTLVHGCKWTVNDVFEYKPLLSLLYSKTLLNDRVFIYDDATNITKAILLGGAGIAKKPACFPINSVREVLETYNVNGNYYDYSCGWGDRLLGALSTGVNYFGTDPNYLLTEKLNELTADYKRVNNVDTTVDIRTQGSEAFVEDWRGKMGLAFSSPPYYDLEDYRTGEQSIKGRSYDDWLRDYVKPTFDNIHAYLIDDGYFALNIKNTNRYSMLDDCMAIAETCGFVFHASHKLKETNARRVPSQTGAYKIVPVDEQILVFKKA